MSKKLKKNVPQLRFPEFEGDWKESKLNKLINLISGQHLSPNEYSLEIGEVPYFTGPSDFTNQVEALTKWTALSDKSGQQGDILITVKGNGVGEMLMLKLPNVVIGRQLMAIRPITVVGEIIYYKLFNYKQELQALASGNVIPGLSRSDLLNIKIYLPNIAEQEKIASLLGAVDRRLNQLRRKRELLQSYKRGVMQKLFTHKVGLRKKKKTPEFRFPEFSGNWQPRKFGEFILKKDVTASDYIPLFSLTIEDGITEKTERYERSFLVKDAEEAYKLVEPNDFVYNPMNLRFGALARNKRNYTVKVSRYYDVFSLDKTVNLLFIEFFLKNHNSIQYYNHMAEGSLIEKKRLHFSNFLEFIFLFPSLKEQEKIAKFLTIIDRKIETITSQIEQTEKFKKGLLQKMFV